MSFDIIFILFVSLCYNGKSLGLINNPKEWMAVMNDNSNKFYIQTNQSKQIHALMNIYRTIKCCDNEKIHESSNILADDMNLLHKSKNTISILNNSMRKKRQLKGNEIVRESSRNQMKIKDKRISLRQDTKKEDKKKKTSENKSQENVDHANEEPPFVGANEEAAKDKEVQQEVNKTDEEVEKHVDALNQEVDKKGDNKKNKKNMEKIENRSAADDDNSSSDDKTESVSQSSSTSDANHNGTTENDSSNETQPSNENKDVENFINKLDKILSSSGDYIIALMLNNYKSRMRANHLDEKFLGKAKEIANKSGGDLNKATKNLEKEIETKLDNEFIGEVADSLKTLAHDINISS